MFSLFIVCLATLLRCKNVSPYVAGDGNYMAAPMIKYFTMPESCKIEDKQFCFSQEGYPKKYVEKLLKDITTLEIDNNDPGDISNCYRSRQGDASIEADCPSTFTNDLIYYIVDEFGNDRVVVQLEGRFQQRFTIAWCQEKGRLNHSTKHFSNTTVQRYEMYCENKYINHDFLVLSLKPDFLGNYKLEMARTADGIPICCACKYMKKAKYVKKSKYVKKAKYVKDSNDMNAIRIL